MQSTSTLGTYLRGSKVRFLRQESSNKTVQVFLSVCGCLRHEEAYRLTCMIPSFEAKPGLPHTEILKSEIVKTNSTTTSIRQPTTDEMKCMSCAALPNSSIICDMLTIVFSSPQGWPCCHHHPWPICGKEGKFSSSSHLR